MCQLFETIRIEHGQAHFVEYHQMRINRSIGHGVVHLQCYITNIELPQNGCYKLRITYTYFGIVEHQLVPYVMAQISTLKLVVDDNICYDKKYEDRSAIASLHAQRNGCDDILIVRKGLITDSSFANIALFDGERWVTPSEPLLAGTCRARLIDQGIIAPANITVESLGKYSKITLINAMIGFDPNRQVVIG